MAWASTYMRFGVSPPCPCGRSVSLMIFAGGPNGRLAQLHDTTGTRTDLAARVAQAVTPHRQSHPQSAFGDTQSETSDACSGSLFESSIEDGFDLGACVRTRCVG